VQLGGSQGRGRNRRRFDTPAKAIANCGSIRTGIRVTQAPHSAPCNALHCWPQEGSEMIMLPKFSTFPPKSLLRRFQQLASSGQPRACRWNRSARLLRDGVLCAEKIVSITGIGDYAESTPGKMAQSGSELLPTLSEVATSRLLLRTMPSSASRCGRGQPRHCVIRGRLAAICASARVAGTFRG